MIWRAIVTVVILYAHTSYIMVVSVVRFFRWCPALLPLGYRLALVIAKYIFSNSLKVCLPLPIGQPKQLFFKQTSYLIPLLAAIRKPVLCHPICQLDQFPTYIWVNATPPPSSGLHVVQSRFMYHPRLHLYYLSPHRHGWPDLLTSI